MTCASCSDSVQHSMSHNSIHYIIIIPSPVHVQLTYVHVYTCIHQFHEFMFLVILRAGLQQGHKRKVNLLTLAMAGLMHCKFTVYEYSN